MCSQRPVFLCHRNRPFHAGLRQLIQKCRKLIHGRNRQRIEFPSQRFFNHRAAFNTEREAIYLSIHLCQITFHLRSPGLSRQINRFFLSQRDHIGSIQNCHSRRRPRVIHADNLGIRRIPIRNRHNLHVDSRFLLIFLRHLRQSHLYLRLGIQKRDFRTRQRRIIFKRIHRRVNRLFLYHLIRIIRITGKSKSAPRQHQDRRHHHNSDFNGLRTNTFHHPHSSFNAAIFIGLILCNR